MKMNLALFPAFKTNHRDPSHSLSPSLHHNNRQPVGGRLGIHNETAPSATPCYIARTTGNVLAVASSPVLPPYGVQPNCDQPEQHPRRNCRDDRDRQKVVLDHDAHGFATITR